MPWIHANLSIVEVVALVVAGLIVLAVFIGFFVNLPALFRYFRISRM